MEVYEYTFIFNQVVDGILIASSSLTFLRYTISAFLRKLQSTSNDPGRVQNESFSLWRKFKLFMVKYSGFKYMVLLGLKGYTAYLYMAYNSGSVSIIENVSVIQCIF
jgi:hypothetical protein